MKVKDILVNCRIKEIVGDTDIDVVDLVFDSRKVTRGSMFFALRGTAVDGHSYIAQAVERGAVAVVCEVMPQSVEQGVTYFLVDDAASTLGECASNYYDNPSSKLRLVGVTGTNGKTTIATLLYRLFTHAGYACGLISTIENIIDHDVVAATHTTPDPISINALLSMMCNKGCEFAFMEVSSHAVDQKRIAGLNFAGGVFTNLTHDHLDYHKTTANYRDAKKRFFDMLPAKAFALTNADDKNGLYMTQNTKASVFTYALRHDADYRARVMESQFDGMLLKINGHELFSRLVGGFNASNLLAIYGTAIQLGMDHDELLAELSGLEGARGRFQVVRSTSGVVGIVDYAHTPDALENVLVTIDEIRTHDEKLITIAGAGGNRDATKRPEMAAVAARYSDKVILTSDNPRNEDPATIIAEMRQGVDPHNARKVLSVVDRREAIRTAVALAGRGDIILLAGKGHETYQEICGQRSHFDDMEEIINAFKELD